METLVLSDSVTIIHGDCCDILPMDCDAVVTDPPYGIGYQHSGRGDKHISASRNLDKIEGDDVPFDPSIVLQMLKIHGGSGSVTPMVLWGANHYANRLPDGQWLCWDKSCGGGAASSFCDAEFAWSSRRIPRNIYRHLWMGVCREGSGDETTQRVHPSQKPVGLMQWCMDVLRIRLGNTVLDPYMGSGTTGIACIRTGRKFIGVEKDARCFETARQRLENELRQGLLPLMYNTAGQRPARNEVTNG